MRKLFILSILQLLFLVAFSQERFALMAKLRFYFQYDKMDCCPACIRMIIWWKVNQNWGT